MTGFAQGQGVFTFSRSSRSYNLYFALRLAAPDRPLLEAVQAFFGEVGRIYDAGTTAYYRICRAAELARVIEHFDRHPLQGEKAATYRLWRAMVELKRVPRKAPPDELARLAARLSARSTRKRLTAGGTPGGAA